MKILGFTLAAVLASATACPYLENRGGSSEDSSNNDMTVEGHRHLKQRRHLQDRFEGSPEAAIAAARQNILDLIIDRPRRGVSAI